jgi:superfamily II DNA or RNA helicase
MLREVEWSEDRSYRSGSENEAVQFYLDGLCNSANFDLLLGYFSSAAINVLSLGFASFLYTGGTMRMVINNVLSQEDKDAIKTGLDREMPINALDLSDIKKLKSSLNEYGKHFFECLSWLIGNDKIQIKIIGPKNGKGIAHYKSGVFFDGTDYVGFKASCNFTAYGLLENLEELESFLSWENGRSNKYINGQKKYFEKIFSEEADFVAYHEVEDVIIAIRNEFGDKTINELIIKEKELAFEKNKVLENTGIRKSFEKINAKIELLSKNPKFPFSKGPRDYQVEAYENWCKNEYKGIFAMATGTGKTLTALNCVLNEYSKCNFYKVIILVPTIVLVEQWEKEVKKFNFQGLVKASSKNNDWKKELDNLRVKELFGLNESFVIISTYKTFISAKFQEFITAVKTKAILIADEAHNIGASAVKKKLEITDINKRIGLSATPKRNYDPEGSESMEAFFHDKEPYTYNFPMDRAIEEGILTQYYYFPKVVELTIDEMVHYNEITLQIVKVFQLSAKDKDAKKRYEDLLMLRKRIIHKAKDKLKAFESIISSLRKEVNGLQYLLVYAPEGYYNDEETLEDSFPEVESDSRIIDNYSNIIRTVSPETTVTQYTSESEEKELILSGFEKGKIDVLLSMKCLDEGVDIPRAEKAIFCSSTGNPRQFIQRRGRILRKHPEKRFAKIYDLVVIPKVSLSSLSYDIERNLVKKELERVVHFAYMAINKYEAIESLREICNYYDLNLDTLHEELK